MMISPSVRDENKRLGFTLLEVVVVMAVTAMLVGVIFSSIHGITTLTQSVTEQSMKLRKESRLQMILERHFKESGRDHLVRLKPMLQGSASELVIADGSTLMPPDSLGRTAVFEVEKAEHGFLNFNLVLLDEKDWLAYDSGNSQVGLRILLLKELKSVEWRCFDPVTEKWVHQYQARETLRQLIGIQSQNTAEKPKHSFTLIELNLGFADGEQQRWVFSLL